MNGSGRWSAGGILAAVVALVLIVLGLAFVVSLAAVMYCPDRRGPVPKQHTPGPTPGGAVVSLAVAEDTTCARTRDGASWCWGAGQVEGPPAAHDDHGFLGQPLLRDAVAIALGPFPSRDHGCALLRGGRVKCWGLDGYHAPAEALRDVVEVAVGSEHGCARLATGRIHCWGWSDAHLLLSLTGDSSNAGRKPVIVEVPGIEDAVRIATGEHHACALRRSGVATCWGGNFAGELGSAARDRRDGPVAVPGVEGIVEIAAGERFTCARLRDGTVRCWGEYDDSSPDPGPDAGAVSVPGVMDVVELAAGPHRICARRTDGHAICWGRARTAPALVPDLEHVTGLAVAEDRSCARIEGGSVRCWSDGEYSVTVGLSRVTATRPALVAGLARIAQIAVASPQTCVVLSDGNVRCWTDHVAGELAVTAGSAYPARAAASARMRHGGFARCTLQDDGTARCTGAGAPSAAELDALAPLANIVIGRDHACALRAEGTAYCWGSNVGGEVGDGTTEPRAAPVRVQGLPAVAEVALGLRHSCARTRDGAVYCWGDGASGQLGDGSRTTRGAPSRVAELEGAAGLALGAFHSCALLGDHTVRCWGANDRGQLGTGTMTEASLPVAVSALGGVTQLLAASDRTCALLADGTARCWGWDYLCERDPAAAWGTCEPPRAWKSPHPVQGLRGAVELGLGDAHACARLADGRMVCWGSNGSGQLGGNLPMYERRIPGGGGCGGEIITDVSLTTDAPVAVAW
jgi:alpha-tubulin suppressor-like RCC1 family protein